jgi:type VI secretion system secreted protein VgrG
MGLLGSGPPPTLSIETEEGQFFVLKMTGHEHLGQMYEYIVELAQVDEESLNPLDEPEKPELAKLIGTAATVSMQIYSEDDKRYFFGYVARAKRGEKRGRYTRYEIALRPGIWFMTRSKDSKVFQEKAVKDIISEILKEYDIEDDWSGLKGTYEKLDYCVQYNETDFDFVHRLLEESGIYYYFEHKDGSQKMIFVDEIGAHEPYPSGNTIKWTVQKTPDPTIMNWYMQEEVRTAELALTEYDFLAPTTKNEGTAKAKKPSKMLGKMDWFEHPARVVQNSIKPETQSAKTAIADRATVRMEELQSAYASATGTTNVRDLGTGMSFDFENDANDKDNDTYVVIAAVYRIDFGDYESIDDLKTSNDHEGYWCDFLCISKTGPNYRTPRITPRPVISGPQTAVVVGASGNEIETDKHGRIKIQFHWDRLGKNDQNSSCWVRVVHPFAGKGYGMFALPRVKDEVVVHFLDGDPDRPIVIGAVYNNENMMAWTLPTQSTLSGYKSRSSKGGDEKGKEANELRFDDKKNSEYIWFHAERDFYRQVEHDAFDWVGNNESVHVTLTRKEAIGENWFVDVTKDVMQNVGKDLHVNVAGDIFYTGEATFQLKLTKDFNAKVDGDVSIEAGGKITLKASSIILEGSSAVTLKSGGSTVNLAGAGVDIVGSMVKVNSGGGGAGASPGKVDKAKKEDSITPEKKSQYEQTFEDPLAKDEGGTGPAQSKAS